MTPKRRRTPPDEGHAGQRFPDPSPELLAAIETLGRAASWTEAKAAIQAHAKLLLTDEGENALRIWADGNEAEGYADHATVIRERLELVRRCRAEGIEVAFHGHLGDADQPALTPEVKRLVGRILQGAGALPSGFAEVIDLTRRTLDLIARKENPDLWGWLHRKLGDALSQVGGAGLEGRLKEALEHYDQALRVFAKADHPREWAEVQLSRAATLAMMPAANRSPNQEAALAVLEEALPVIEALCAVPDRVGARGNLGALYSERLLGDHADNVEQAILHLREGLALVERNSDPVGWAGLANNLGTALLGRERASAAANLEEALELLEDAAEILRGPPPRPMYATAENNLALVFLERVEGERYHNLEVAFEHAEASLAAADPNLLPLDAVRARNTMALIFHVRLAGDRTRNLESAVEHAEAGLQLARHHHLPHMVSGLLVNLGNALQAFDEGAASPERVRQAIAVYEDLLKTGGPQAPRYDRMLALMNLGNAQRRLGQSGDAFGFDRALLRFEQARTLAPRAERPLDWYRLTVNLAVAHRDLSRDPDDDHARSAEKLYREAAEVLVAEERPADAFRLYSGLGGLLSDRGAWKKAAEAYLTAMDAADLLLDTASSEPGRRAEVRAGRHVFGRAVDALVEAGRIGDALLAAERGRARLLREALLASEGALGRLPEAARRQVGEARRRIRRLEEEMRQPPGSPHRRSDVELGHLLGEERRSLRTLLAGRAGEAGAPEAVARDLGEVLGAAPPGGALVVLARSSRRGIAFVVPAGCSAVDATHVAILDALDPPAVHALLFASGEEPGWLFAFSLHKTRALGGGWPAFVERYCNRLWPTVCAPLHAKLVELGVGPGAPVVLLPSGELALLPLHAATREVEGRRRCLLDDYQVVYAPSALAFRASRQRAEVTDAGGGVLIVVDPTGDLEHAAEEGGEVADRFGSAALRLDGAAATREAVLDHMAGRRYLHFACHGSHVPWDPLASGLQLARRDVLTVGDCLARPVLDGARLVTLSACETGMTGVLDLPDEFVGLPAGVLEAGAAAVVSSLWPVDDRATALLMRRFYANHLRRGKPMPPAAALREAQLWLRDASEAELERPSGAGEAIGESRREVVPLHASREAGRRRYANPFFWAGFVLTGW